MKIKCVVIDDESPALDLICEYVNRTPFLELVGSSNNGLEILEEINKLEVQLIFMDIEMPDISGLKLSTMIRKGPKIVFTTAYDQYAIEGYKVDAFDYLLKPISYEEFLEVALKYRNDFISQQISTSSVSESTSYIFVNSNYKLIKLNFDEILYVEGYKDYVKFHLESSKSPILSLVSLKKLEKKLPNRAFLRVHRSFIINLNKIVSIERRIINFKKGTAKYSDQYNDEFFKRINAV